MFRKTKCLHIQDVYRKVSHKEKEWEEKKRENKYKRIDKFAYIQLYYCFNLYSNRKQRNGLQQREKKDERAFIYLLYL